VLSAGVMRQCAIGVGAEAESPTTALRKRVKEALKDRKVTAAELSAILNKFIRTHIALLNELEACYEQVEQQKQGVSVSKSFSNRTKLLNSITSLVGVVGVGGLLSWAFRIAPADGFFSVPLLPPGFSVALSAKVQQAMTFTAGGNDSSNPLLASAATAVSVEEPYYFKAAKKMEEEILAAFKGTPPKIFTKEVNKLLNAYSRRQQELMASLADCDSAIQNVEQQGAPTAEENASARREAYHAFGITVLALTALTGSLYYLSERLAANQAAEIEWSEVADYQRRMQARYGGPGGGYAAAK
jgi:hypothetical protein